MIITILVVILIYINDTNSEDFRQLDQMEFDV